MLTIDEMISGYRNESDVDYVGLWQIANRIENENHTDSQEDIMRQSLQVVRGLMEEGVYPGDYAIGGFTFWTGTAENNMKRIEAEWSALNQTPSLVYPICWFALRRSDSASS